MFLRRRQIIGLDLSGSTAKGIVLEYGGPGDPVVVRDYVIAPETDPQAPLIERLRKLLKKLRTRSRECAVCAWPEGARLRLFEGQTEPELMRQLHLRRPEAGALFHEELSDYAAACGPVAGKKAHVPTSTFVATGVPRSELKLLEATLEKLGYSLTLFQLGPIALLNAFTASHPEVTAQDPFLLVDLGRERATILAGWHGTVQLFRVIDLDWRELAGDEPADAGGADEALDELAELFKLTWRDAAAILVGQLWVVIDSLRAGDQLRSLQAIHLSGALSNSEVLIRRLGESFTLPSRQWNPFRQISAGGRALKDFSLLRDLAHLPGAAGAAFQVAA